MAGEGPAPGQGNAVVRVFPLQLPAPTYAPFTYPRYRPFLREDGGGSSGALAVGARLGPRPVGLVLVAPPRQDRSRLLLSVAVDRSLRSMGIGSRLLASAEEHARALGCPRLVGNYSTLTVARPAVEALLRGGGWSEPRTQEYRWRSPVGLVEKAEREWSTVRQRAMARGFRVVPWAEVDREALDCVANLTQAPDFDAVLNPFPLMPRYDPDLTLVLYQNDEVVGWIVGGYDPVNHQGSYPVGYVIPRLQRFGWLIVGIVEAARRQAHRYGPDTTGLFATYPGTGKMLSFMARRMAPVLQPGFMEERFWSEKILSSEPHAPGLPQP